MARRFRDCNAADGVGPTDADFRLHDLTPPRAKLTEALDASAQRVRPQPNSREPRRRRLSYCVNSTALAAGTFTVYELPTASAGWDCGGGRLPVVVAVPNV